MAQNIAYLFNLVSKLLNLTPICLEVEYFEVNSDFVEAQLELLVNHSQFTSTSGLNTGLWFADIWWIVDLNIGLANYSDILPKLKSKLHTCSVGHNVEMAPNIGDINPLHSSNIFSCNRDGVSHVGVGNVNLDIQVCDVLDTRVVRVVNLETIQ